MTHANIDPETNPRAWRLSIERRHFPQFFITAPAPCPYLAGQLERKVFTHLIGA